MRGNKIRRGKQEEKSHGFSTESHYLQSETLTLYFNMYLHQRDVHFVTTKLFTLELTLVLQTRFDIAKRLESSHQVLIR